jgi:hypothetical protein
MAPGNRARDRFFGCDRSSGEHMMEASGASRTKESPDERGFPNAPEKTRTSTDHTVHKALNHVHVVWMLLAASRSGKSLGLLDVLDVTEGVDVVTSVVTLDELCAGPGCLASPSRSSAKSCAPHDHDVRIAQVVRNLRGHPTCDTTGQSFDGPAGRRSVAGVRGHS